MGIAIAIRTIIRKKKQQQHTHIQVPWLNVQTHVIKEKTFFYAFPVYIKKSVFSLSLSFAIKGL